MIRCDTHPQVEFKQLVRSVRSRVCAIVQRHGDLTEYIHKTTANRPEHALVIDTRNSSLASLWFAYSLTGPRRIERANCEFAPRQRRS
jgi:hypothetical protein